MKLRLYPNPAGDFLIIEGEGLQEARLQLREISGKLLLSTELHANKTRIDLSGICEGFYILHLSRSDGSRSAQSLILQ